MKIERTRRGALRARCKVLTLTPTDAPGVYTAGLECGHAQRFNVPPMHRSPATAICRACTEEAAAKQKSPLPRQSEEGL